MRRTVSPSESPPSKTRRKQDMLALQELGTALVGLDPAKLALIELPEPLAEAIAEARSITRHEARRRQLQYVGRLMRDVDPAPIRAALERLDSVPRAQRVAFAAAEEWRERLLEDDTALADFVADHPSADRDELASLVGEARAERAGGRPPHKFRALFRRIAEALEPPKT
jgi:ribosome-associated protein